MADSPSTGTDFLGDVSGAEVDATDPLIADLAETPEEPEAVAPPETVEETPEPEAETEETPPETPAETPPETPVETPAEPEAEAETEAPEGEVVEEAPHKFAGKFETPEALEAAYVNLETVLGRQVADFRTREQGLSKQLQERQAAIERVVPVLQRLQASGVLDEVMSGEAAQLQPQEIEAQYQQRLQGERQQMQQQQQQQDANRAISEFRSESEVPVGSPYDSDIVRFVSEFQADTDQSGTPVQNPFLFPITKENLKVAYELARDPRLYGVYQEFDLEPSLYDTQPDGSLVFDPEAQMNLQYAKEIADNPSLAHQLRIHPHLLASDAGMGEARRLAGLPETRTQAAPLTQPAVNVGRRQAAKEQRAKAHVIKGGTGAPVSTAPGRKGDEFDEAMDIAKSDNAGRLGF